MPVFKIRFSSVYVEMKRKVADSRQLNATIVMGGKAEFCTNNKALLAAMTAFPNVKYSILNPFDFHKEGRVDHKRQSLTLSSGLIFSLLGRVCIRYILSVGKHPTIPGNLINCLCISD